MINDNELLEYYKDHSIKECAEKFGSTYDIIRYRLKKLNASKIHKPPNKKEIDIDRLLEYYKDHTLDECSKIFKCSARSLGEKLKKAGYKTGLHYYKNVDIDKLIKLRESHTIKECAQKLGISRGLVIRILHKHGFKKEKKYSDADVIELYKNNTISECARKLNISQSTVRSVLKSYNVEITYSVIDRSIDIDSLIKYHEEHTLSECASKFNASVAQIVRILRNNNVNTSKHHGKKQIIVNDQELIDYYNNYNMEECAEKFGCSVGTIRNRLEILGIRIKKPKFTHTSKYKITQSNRKRWENEEYRNKMAIHRQNMPNVSSIQLALYSILDDLNIKYYKEYEDGNFDEQTVIGGYKFDCVIPRTGQRDLLIECQGDYWHSHPSTQRSDRAKASYIANNFSDKYELKYLWEHEFKCKEKILELIKYWFGITKIDVIDFDFKDIIIKSSPASDYKLLLSKYHYLPNAGRGGDAWGAYLNNDLIATCVFSPLVRQNIHIENFNKKEVRELSRLCIHPRYQKKNFASWFVSRCIKNLDAKYKAVIAYCDTTFNHDGAVYRACNFCEYGEVRPDYWYRDENGWVMHKRTLYGHANSMKMKESEFAEKYGYYRVFGEKKLRFLFIR